MNFDWLPSWCCCCVIPLSSNRWHLNNYSWRKIIRTVLCCVWHLCTMMCTHNEHLFNLHIGFGLGFLLVFFVLVLLNLGHRIIVFFCVGFIYFCRTSQAICLGKMLTKWPVCVKCDVKPQLGRFVWWRWTNVMVLLYRMSNRRCSGVLHTSYSSLIYKHT